MKVKGERSSHNILASANKKPHVKNCGKFEENSKVEMEKNKIHN